MPNVKHVWHSSPNKYYRTPSKLIISWLRSLQKAKFQERRFPALCKTRTALAFEFGPFPYPDRERNASLYVTSEMYCISIQGACSYTVYVRSTTAALERMLWWGPYHCHKNIGIRIPARSHEDQQRPRSPEAPLFGYPAKEVYKIPEEDVNRAVKKTQCKSEVQGKENKH